ncbi:MAG TPA: putative metal-binding protein, partial [Candidatus Angelobacter sp.]|nr:putative metal-binding protein [Candidatus Angelobacter sp.]
MAASELLVDPKISKAKFDREVDEFRKLERTYQERGWWLLEANYPVAFIVFAAQQLSPPAVVFGALLEFSNYDIWPPSVTIVDPFTREPYKQKELKVILNRKVSTVVIPGFGVKVDVQPLLVAHSGEDIPFLCIPGVREYHSHPAHTGNSWFLHR